MRLSRRNVFSYLALAAGVAAVAWAVSFRAEEPADLTFCNGVEIKSIDPKVVTGSAEGRVLRGLFEGLVDWDPRDLHPVPAVARSWDISADGRTYVMHLREEALWSDGSPVTAGDFVYSWRRFLDPTSGAEYAPLLHHVVGGEKYNQGTINPGDAVEVELPRPQPSGGPRGTVLKGKLLAVEQTGEGNEHDDNGRRYLVEIDGQRRRFVPHAQVDGEVLDESVELCEQVLPDFGLVGIKAVDDHTLRIELVAEVPFFLNLLGFYPLFPVHRQCVETHGYPAWTLKKNLVNNGPFLLESRRVGDKIRLRKNPRYWDRDSIHLETVDILAVSSDTTALNLYMTGKVDWIIRVPATIIPEIVERRRDDFNPVLEFRTYFFEINTAKPPLDDARVRKALALAMNNRQIVEKVTRAGEIPTRRLVPPGIDDYDELKRTLGVSEDFSPEAYEDDVRRARQLLAEAGYPGGRGLAKIELQYNYSETHEQIAELLQAQWKEALGVRVELMKKDWSSYLTDRRQGNYSISRAGWIGDYADPYTFLELFVTGHPQNHSQWSNAEFDRLMNQTKDVQLAPGEREAVEREVRKQEGWTPEDHPRRLDEAIGLRRRMKRMRLFHDAEQILIEEQPMLGVFINVSQSLVRPYVKGFYRNLQDVHTYRGISIDRQEKARVLAGEGLR